MKKKLPTNGGSGDFKRFDALFRKVVSVPKEEIKRREEAEKQKKKAQKS